MEKTELVNQLFTMLKESKLCKTRRYKKGEIITNYIQHRDMLHCLLSGSANLVRYTRSGEEQFIEKYARYDYFGDGFHEIILNNEYSVIAKRECVVFSVNVADLIEFEENQSLMLLIQEMLKIRIREISAHNTILLQKTTRAKIQEYFNFLSRRSLMRNFELPMNYSEMAVYLGVDRASMTREISLLEKDGFLIKKGHHIRILW